MVEVDSFSSDPTISTGRSEPTSGPAIVGISAFYHESACCLTVGGELVAAAAEERFSRVKHDRRLPVEAFRFCLAAGGLAVSDLDAVAYYELPVVKLSRQLAFPPLGALTGREADDLTWLDPHGPELSIRERLGWEGPLYSFGHHRCHAASAFFFSGFEQAAVLTVDGVGEWSTTSYGRGDRSRPGVEALELFEEVAFPHSLGLPYATVTAYLGFAVNSGEYKVMGLAPYGEPRFLERLRRVVAVGGGGQYRLDPAYFAFARSGAGARADDPDLVGSTMYSPALCDLLEGPPRRPDEPLTQRHRDIARSIQALLEELLLDKVGWLHRATGCTDLAMAGGVALNCVANGRIAREGPFDRLFVQPAAGDAGGCLGAAALAHRLLAGDRPSPPGVAAASRGHGAEGGSSPVRRPAPLASMALGPAWDPDAIAALLATADLPSEDYRHRPDELLAATADLLAAGQVVAWFHGAMEHGPRALGGRSLLADPRDPAMRERINRLVKRRERFRPFAPAVLAERAAEYFEIDPRCHAAGRFMLLTCRVREPELLAAVTHVDGSARPQLVERAALPRFAALLDAFAERTGLPVLLNTSFNVRGEPIVCTPADALLAFGDLGGALGIDALVLEDHLLTADRLAPHLPRLAALWRQPPPRPFSDRRSPLGGGLYTFV